MGAEAQMSMGHMPLILIIAGLTYLTRISGLLTGNWRPSPFVRRALDYIPIAAFTALIVPGLDIGGPEQGSRILAGAMALLLAVTTRQLWLVVLGGLSVYWLVSGLVFG